MRNSKSRSEPGRERAELMRLGLCAGLVLAAWMVVYGWRPGLFLSKFDAASPGLAYMREVLRAGGDWTKLLYRASWIGGTKISPIAGVSPLNWLCAKMGLSEVASLNLSILLVQVLYAFLGLRIALDLLRLLNGPGRSEPGALWRCGLALLCAFSPFIGWRVEFGDQFGIWGSFFFLGVVALFTAALAETVSATLVAACAFGFLNGFMSLGQQHLVYSAVFGLPILAGTAWLKPRAALKSLRWPLGVTAAALLAAAPQYAEMIRHQLSSDSLRALSHAGFSITYTDFVARARDWLSGIFWALELVPSGRRPLDFHETNYPIGPVLLLLPLLPWRKARSVALGLALSGLAAVLFASKIEPFATIALALVPPLNFFRVPARAFLPFSFFLPILAAVALASGLSGQEPRGKALVATALAALLVFFLPPAARDLALFAGLAIMVAHVLKRRDPRFLAAGALALVLAAGSLSAFKERLTPFFTTDEVVTDPLAVGEKLKREQPALRSPLTRARFEFQSPAFQAGTPLAHGISTYDGYWPLTRRYSRLMLRAAGLEYDPGKTYFILYGKELRTAMAQLYNVPFAAVLEKDEPHLVRTEWAPAGEAWIAPGLRHFKSIEDIADALVKQGAQVAQAVHRELWVADEDDAVGAASLPARFSASCAAARFSEIEAGFHDQRIQARVSWPKGAALPQACPLVFATSFATTLRARDGRTGHELKVFPAYGSLLAVLVPADTSEVLVEAMPQAPFWTRPLGLLGYALLIALTAWAFWRRPRTRSRAA